MTAHGAHPLARLLARKRLRVLGINSGTSVDRLDGAMVEIETSGRATTYRVRRVFTRRFPPPLRGELCQLAIDAKVAKRRVSAAHLALGRFIGQSARLWMRGMPADLVASHGQTIAHCPDGPHRATWQIGAVNAVAIECGTAVIGDFRLADVAAGGMGAPLSGYYHHLLFGEGVPVLNIGGIANVSVSSTVRGRLNITAFDTGPGNMILDALAQKRVGRPFDRDGQSAARGAIQPGLLARLLALPYFQRRPPKTCGREQFGWDAVGRFFERSRLDTNDALSTATELTAWSIADAVRRWIAPRTAHRTLVVSGGGVANRHLRDRLGAYLGEWQLTPADTLGVPARFVEPVGFAALAGETLQARAGNCGGATGARRMAVLGVLALPSPEA
jgi:anhydro-N-acetylmuramic acid kinase